MSVSGLIIIKDLKLRNYECVDTSVLILMVCLLFNGLFILSMASVLIGMLQIGLVLALSWGLPVSTFDFLTAPWGCRSRCLSRRWQMKERGRAKWGRGRTLIRNSKPPPLYSTGFGNHGFLKKPIICSIEKRRLNLVLWVMFIISALLRPAWETLSPPPQKKDKKNEYLSSYTLKHIFNCEGHTCRKYENKHILCPNI